MFYIGIYFISNSCGYYTGSNNCGFTTCCCDSFYFLFLTPTEGLGKLL